MREAYKLFDKPSITRNTVSDVYYLRCYLYKAEYLGEDPRWLRFTVDILKGATRCVIWDEEDELCDGGSLD